MNANELRIGNWLKGAYEFQIQEISNHDYNVYDPIPLTEEWLLKFGMAFNHKWCIYFLPDDISYHDLSGDYATPDERNFKLQAVSDGVFYLNIEGLNWGKPIQYVHALQNLFFALTGKELSIRN